MTKPTTPEQDRARLGDEFNQAVAEMKGIATFAASRHTQDVLTLTQIAQGNFPFTPFIRQAILKVMAPESQADYERLRPLHAAGFACLSEVRQLAAQYLEYPESGNVPPDPISITYQGEQSPALDSTILLSKQTQ